MVVERVVDRVWRQESWRGSPTELADLLSELKQLVMTASQDAEEPRTYITLSEGGSDLVFSSVAEFSEFARGADPRLRGAKQLYVSIGRLTGDVEVTVFAERSRQLFARSIQATVRGRNPVAVNGVAEEGKAVLQRGDWNLSVRWLYWTVWTVGLVLSWAPYAAAAAISDGTREVIGWIGAAILVAAVCLMFAAPFVVPPFEVIDPKAEKIGAARFRSALSASGRWLLAVLAGAVIYAVVQRLVEAA
ncbi:MAG TPA: hypothetical protein VHF50_03005 [Solirubrobacterales bacterium]|nr:hypothetical protein [Solirubrobacterales bacterium]